MVYDPEENITIQALFSIKCDSTNCKNRGNSVCCILVADCTLSSIRCLLCVCVKFGFNNDIIIDNDKNDSERRRRSVSLNIIETFLKLIE